MLRRELLAGLGAIALAGCAPSTGGGGITSNGRRVVAASELADRSAVRFRHLDSVNAIRATWLVSTLLMVIRLNISSSRLLLGEDASCVEDDAI